jgi:hypothetical protein
MSLAIVNLHVVKSIWNAVCVVYLTGGSHAGKEEKV